MRFSVMTFNIRGAGHKDGENVWEKRSDLNVRTILKYKPDIIGFQEFQQGNLLTYVSNLNGYDVALGKRCNTLGEKYERPPIYWSNDRFELVDTDSFYLNPTPNEWRVGWNAHFVRGANWVILRHKESGEKVFMLNTHLDHRGEMARVESAKLIVDQIARLRRGFPVIVTGDFNSTVWRPPLDQLPEHIRNEDDPVRSAPAGTVHRIFMEAGYKDTFYESGNTDHVDTNTFHNFQGTAFPPVAARIDWILTSPEINTLGYEIIRDGEPPLFPSDHYPVMANLETSH